MTSDSPFCILTSIEGLCYHPFSLNYDHEDNFHFFSRGGHDFIILGFNRALYVCVCVLASQLCPTLCDPLDCSPPGSSVQGILQERILEWIAIPFSRESSCPRDWTQVSCIASRFFAIWATSKAPEWRGWKGLLFNEKCFTLHTFVGPEAHSLIA